MAIGNNMSQKRANGLIAIETITKSLAIKHALLLGLNQKIISLCNILVRFIVRPTMASEILLVMFHQNNASFSQCERLLFYKDYYIDQEPSLQSHFGTTTTYITKHGANDIISYFLYSLLDQCFLILFLYIIDTFQIGVWQVHSMVIWQTLCKKLRKHTLRPEPRVKPHLHLME